jgi:hypothetical protein
MWCIILKNFVYYIKNSKYYIKKLGVLYLKNFYIILKNLVYSIISSVYYMTKSVNFINKNFLLKKTNKFTIKLVHLAFHKEYKIKWKV